MNLVLRVIYPSYIYSHHEIAYILSSSPPQMNTTLYSYMTMMKNDNDNDNDDNDDDN
jgi:hypothetical protein